MPATKAADELLSEFKRVVLAWPSWSTVGRVVGIVTLDDLLEELVGEMADETDAENPAVTQIDAQSWSVRGNMSIEDFAERFHVLIPDGPYVDLAGLVAAVSTSALHRREVEWNGVCFKVEHMKGILPSQVSLTLDQAYEEDDPTMDGDFQTEEST